MIALSDVYDKPKHQQHSYTPLHHHPPWGEHSGVSHSAFPASFVPGRMIQAGRGTAHSQPTAVLPKLSTTACQHQLKQAAMLKAAFCLPKAGKAEGSPSSTAPSPHQSPAGSGAYSMALGHRQSRDNSTGATRSMDAASWMGEPLGRAGCVPRTPARQLTIHFNKPTRLHQQW